MALSALGLLLTLYWAWARRSGRDGVDSSWMRPWRLVCLLAIIFGSFNYYNFNKQWAEGFDDYTDITYYYLNSKYFEELGYTNLYEAMLVADLEGPRRVAPKIRTIRSLVTYEEEPAAVALAEGPDVREAFTPERWEAFKHDTDWFLRNRIAEHGIRGLQKNFFVDHGYNPPPTWTLLGGTFSSLVPVEKVKWITSLDLVLILAMFLLIARSFGVHVALLVGVWYVGTFSSRWPVLTHSLFRFDWVVALTCGICFLSLRRHALAGAMLTWAALSRVFPFIFGVPLVARMAWDAWQERRVSRETRSFVNGAVGTLGVTVLLAWMMVGTSGFVTGAENLVKHNGAEAYSSQKVGLGDALFYRGETTRLEMRKQPCGGFERLIGSDCEEHGNIYGKSKLLKLIEPQLKLVGVGAIILVCLFAIRSRRPLHQLPPLAVLPLFCLTNPSYYYYILRIVLVLFHAENLSRRSNVVGLCLLFAMEISAHATKLAGYERYTTTATTSWWLIVYFVVVGTLMVREMLDDEAQPENE